MKIKDYLPIYEFLEDHGCVFDNIVCGYNDIKCKSILEALFYNNFRLIVSPEIIEFALNYSKETDLESAINFDGNIVDIIMKMNNYQLLLKIFQTFKTVVFPIKTNIDLFYQWIQNSNDISLINFVFHKE